MERTTKRPTAAMAVALLALFIALSGTAIAAAPIVAKARFALNAGKLQGKTATQVAGMAVGGKTAEQIAAMALGGKTAEEIAAMPGPASSVVGLLTVRRGTQHFNSNGEGYVSAGCAAGEKVLGGGWRGSPSNRDVLALEDGPTDEGTGWRVYLWNGNARADAQIEVLAVCVK